MKKNPPIVHIGFPKTGSTSLKKHVLPYLCNEMGYLFNPPEFIKISRQFLVYSKEDKSALQSLFENNKVLISQERLIDSNPSNWENAADKVLDLFGREAKIIITIRNPLDYLCSLYVQLIHNGNIVKAEDFFVNSEEHEKLDPFLAKQSFMRLDFTKLNYEHLKQIYESRFSEVYFTPLSYIDNLYPFTNLLSLNQETINKFKKIFKNSPTENRSYSRNALNLTFYRERLFRLIGVKTIGNEDIPDNNDFLIYSKPISKFLDLPFKDKLKEFSPRIFSKLGNTLGSWRWWMQNILDKIYPYKKYYLPETVKNKLKTKLMEDNLKFISNLENQVDNEKHLKVTKNVNW